MLFDVCKWLEHNSWVIAINRSVLISLFVYMIHYLSLFLIVGSMVFVDLGVLGALGQRHNIAGLSERASPVLWIGLAFVTVTGFLMFSADATAYYVSQSFHVKLLAILLAVVSGVIIQSNISKWDQLPAMPTTGKFLALISLLLWLGSILASVEVRTVFQNPT